MVKMFSYINLIQDLWCVLKSSELNKKSAYLTNLYKNDSYGEQLSLTLNHTPEMYAAI